MTDATEPSKSIHDLNSVFKRDVELNGPMRWDNFMREALYHPDFGYYNREAEGRVGKRGDFYTSVSVGSCLGLLIAFQSWDWLRERDRERKSQDNDKPFRLMECGAHDGSLAVDVLEAATKYASNSDATKEAWLEYWILEPSCSRRMLQENRLKERLGSDGLKNVHWVSSWEEGQQRLKDNRVNEGQDLYRGWDLIFGNELLDAFPVRRFVWSKSDQLWEESGVEWDESTETWKWASLPGVSFEKLPAPDHAQWATTEVMDQLADGFVIEWSPEAERWWRDAADALCPGGRLWTLDYGHETERFWEAARSKGTLRAYKNHQLMDNPLANPGDQDLTAAVHFTAIRNIGERSGLITETHPLETQAKNLTEVLKKLWIWKEANTEKPEAPWAEFEWSPQFARQFQTLTHPEHLGSIFRCLIQQKPETTSSLI